MVDRSHALKVGIFVLVLAGALGAVAMTVDRESDDRVPYVVVSREPVVGLSAGSSMSYRGVPAGEVDSIRIDPGDPRKVLVRILVNRSIPVTGSTYATLRTQLVTGRSTLELQDTFEEPRPLRTSAEHPARIGMRPSPMQQVQQALPRLLERLDRLARSIEHARPGRMVEDISRFTRVLPRVGKELERTAAALGPLGHDAGRTLRRVDRLVGSLQGAAGSLNALLASVTEAGEAASAAGRELARRTVPKANAAMDALKGASHDLSALADQLRARPQSLVFGNAPPEPGPGEDKLDGDRR